MYKRDRLEQMEKNLYSRAPRPHAMEGSRGLSKESIEVSDHWQDGEGARPEFKYYSKKVSSLSKKIMIFSLLFFLIALAFGFYIYYKGSNVFSSDNIEINVLGPVGVAGGEELGLEIEVKNNNNIDLENAVLKIEYPDGTREASDIALLLKRKQEPLGSLSPGASAKKKVSAVLFGEENSVKEISISVEYRVKNSNAIYEKMKKFEISLTSAPLSIKIDALKEINSGQDIEFSIDVTSNSPALLKDLVLKAEYPFGFSFKEATPRASYDSDVWKIGDLKAGEKRKVKIKGKLDGQDGEERTFRFYAGLQSRKNEKELEPVFLAATHSLDIKKPFIGVDVTLDGQSLPIYVTLPGRSIRGDIGWENNLSSQVSDVVIEVKITGRVDRSSIAATLGFYNSSEDTIFWDSSTISDLRLVNPGNGGRVGFSFFPLVPDTGSLVKNPEILLSVNVKGKRRDDTGVLEEIFSTVTKKVRLQTGLSLDSKMFYYNGPFKNTGPIPPQAEKETTYTVTWTVGNTFNDARDVTVSATVPPYVTWLGVVDPQNEEVSYTPSGGSIVWDIGDVRSGEGGSSLGRKVSFQISFLPSLSQLGTVPILVNAPVVTGVDRFTQTEITKTGTNLTTLLSADDHYKSGDEKVVR